MNYNIIDGRLVGKKRLQGPPVCSTLTVACNTNLETRNAKTS